MPKAAMPNVALPFVLWSLPSIRPYPLAPCFQEAMREDHSSVFGLLKMLWHRGTTRRRNVSLRQSHLAYGIAWCRAALLAFRPEVRSIAFRIAPLPNEARLRRHPRRV
jgi:hypothetical protein